MPVSPGGALYGDDFNQGLITGFGIHRGKGWVFLSAIFEFRDVVYRDIITVTGLSIQAGTLLGVTGESGSGKSTLLKLLNNMITCDQGEVLFYGENILKSEPVALRRRITMMPQSPYIFPTTVLENIHQACRYAQKPQPPQEKITLQLEALGLQGILHREASTLSGGEKQRLALARALLLNPEALLLDEPTAALDEETQETVLQVIADWVKTGQKTAIMVTHARDAAATYADCVIRMSRGRVFDLWERGRNSG
jgi:putative ABC transport system ATP-binding protein